MDKDFWCDFVAGWLGGCAGLVVGHPLDTIKVRQQTLRKVSVLGGITNTFRYEGVRGFYKGMGFPLLATGTLNALFFGVYANTLRLISPGKDKPTYAQIFVSGCAGGLAQLVVACPVDLVKIKMQMQMGVAEGKWGKTIGHAYAGPMSCLKDLYRKGGIRGCYAGLGSMVVRDVPSFGSYMVLYDSMIASISGSEKNANTGVLIFCGGMAGVLSWASILPLDVVKSRLQADNPTNPQYKGTVDCLIKSYKADGLSVFGRGFTMMSVRAFPTNGAIFLGYVTSLNVMKQVTVGGEQADMVVT
ncbi:solute carrier family 25 member 45-like isoform X2 [Portunus trituberculatus]|uniref:solute carrier family 25 member 45-like isoform X1 n=1 Tax=Portunus trituberculatus TaxID=210409 RepID=UPI001E1D0756|nr:solute carrier family 25 member 45-like isoform X1 [Portunus trituberculatus]XP_045108906.1 solute carrier family 25 member 45-like isoform X2 [Portunus trituberculatus]